MTKSDRIFYKCILYNEDGCNYFNIVAVFFVNAVLMRRILENVKQNFCYITDKMRLRRFQQ